MITVTEEIKIDIAELRKDIHYLTESVRKGFAGVHERQDLTNGKVLRNAENISIMTNKIENCLTKDEYKKDVQKALQNRIKNFSHWRSYAFQTVIGLLVAVFLIWIGSTFGG